jgi:hypothetical protein
LAADADVRMLWRTDVAPAKVNSINLGVAEAASRPQSWPTIPIGSAASPVSRS